MFELLCHYRYKVAPWVSIVLRSLGDGLTWLVGCVRPRTSVRNQCPAVSDDVAACDGFDASPVRNIFEKATPDAI